MTHEALTENQRLHEIFALEMSKKDDAFNAVIAIKDREIMELRTLLEIMRARLKETEEKP